MQHRILYKQASGYGNADMSDSLMDYRLTAAGILAGGVLGSLAGAYIPLFGQRWANIAFFGFRGASYGGVIGNAFDQRRNRGSGHARREVPEYMQQSEA